jgi:hypothetical protein
VVPANRKRVAVDQKTKGQDGTVDGAGTPAAVDLPVTSLNDALPMLRRPFTPAAVKFKVQRKLGEAGVQIVGYIDARLVIERLNLVVGDQWSASYEIGAASTGAT